MDLKKILASRNPWWDDGRPPPEVDNPQRLYYPRFASMVLNTGPGWITVLMGMRRVGKTHMLKQLAGDVLRQGAYEPGQVVFIDASYSNLRKRSIEEIIQACRRDIVKPDREWLLLIDEIQVFDDWEGQLKFIADHLRGFRCAVTGSAATALKKKRSDSGLGRLQELKMPPLLFCEHLRFCGKWPAGLPQEGFDSIAAARLAPSELGDLNREFINYMDFGSFPALAFEYGQRGTPAMQMMAEQIRDHVVNPFVLSDLPSLLGATNIALLHELGQRLIANNAREYSQDAFARQLEAAPATVRKYIVFLEAVHFIRAFKKINERRNTLQYSHTHCRFILENCSIPSLAAAPFGGDHRRNEQRVKGAVLAQFGTNRLGNFGYAVFSRDGKKAKIDLCHFNIHRSPLLLAEVRWRDDDGAFDEAKANFDHLMAKWCEKDGPRTNLYCTSESVYGERGGMRVIPAAQLSVALGMNRVAGYPFHLPRPKTSS